MDYQQGICPFAAQALRLQLYIQKTTTVSLGQVQLAGWCTPLRVWQLAKSYNTLQIGSMGEQMQITRHIYELQKLS